MSKAAPPLPIKPSVLVSSTELVINAVKHAFPDDRNDGTVIVAYDLAEPNWRLTVSDKGSVGRTATRTRQIPG
jgi:anti-sigma regulatory factor (Ser/Thr protein kinase)